MIQNFTVSMTGGRNPDLSALFLFRIDPIDEEIKSHATPGGL